MDSAEDSRGFSDRIAADGKGPLSFPLLSDPRHEVIDAYGLRDPRYARLGKDGIPSPTAYVIGKSGRIAWMRIDRDHRVRPANAEIRAALDALR
jgi:peroxiredoxin